MKVEKPKYNFRKEMQLKARANKANTAVKKFVKQGLEPLKKLKKALWEVFSLYIRTRDSKDGFFWCISCGKYHSVANGNLQAGHYHKSSMSAALRYSEINVNGQCYVCNIHLEGNRQGYEKGLVKKYGAHVLDLLDAQRNNKVKWTRWGYTILIDEYKTKLHYENK